MATSFHDALQRLAQAGSSAGAGLFRITQLDEGNRYVARPIEFDEDGSTVLVGQTVVKVTNLAEPAASPGAVPAGTDVVAVDVEGRWVAFVRPSGAVFPARIVSSEGSAAYLVREQVVTEEGGLADKQGAADVDARNLAELSLGDGAAVDDDTVVLVWAVADAGTPPTVRYFFDHPAYAKYLD